jgi:hypothetical protein
MIISKRSKFLLFLEWGNLVHASLLGREVNILEIVLQEASATIFLSLR